MQSIEQARTRFPPLHFSPEREVDQLMNDEMDGLKDYLDHNC